ncbi:MAG: GLPGLI family protein [Bacteroidota bacterium]|nr:GLPGLI family protein [Bacteroidota bacterium]
MKNLCIAILASFCSISLFAQQMFISKGKIEFEKKENIYKTLEMLQEEESEGDDSWLQSIKKNTPQFSVTYFDLLFDENKSLYKPGRENDNEKMNMQWLQSPASENIIFTNLANGNHVSQKNIYGSYFLIQDSARKVQWRITAETRDIAGFTCRKAVGKMLDSIYVVAFYTDQILPNSGPESFQGLPGMILGVAIPRLNTTWFATKLILAPITDANVTAPTKGKKQTETDFNNTLQSLMKDWGKWGKRRALQAII